MTTTTAATNLIIRKSFDGITKVVDEQQGLVEAIVNTTGIEDLQSDVMEVGSWDGVCKAMSMGEVDYPSVLWGHDWAIPVGKVLHAEELMPGDVRLKAAKATPEVGGLRIIAQYNLDTQRGREAYSDVSKGVIKQWSVGFIPSEDGHKYDAKGIHRISKVGLWPEVSNVLVGASPGTRTTATKSAEDVLASAISRQDKVLAIEQVCLQTVESGDQSEALFIALAALRALGDDITPAPAPVPAIDMAALVNLVVERLAPPSQSQYSDLELSSDDGQEPIPSFGRLNTRR